MLFLFFFRGRSRLESNVLVWVTRFCLIVFVRLHLSFLTLINRDHLCILIGIHIITISINIFVGINNIFFLLWSTLSVSMCIFIFLLLRHYVLVICFLILWRNFYSNIWKSFTLIGYVDPLLRSLYEAVEIMWILVLQFQRGEKVDPIFIRFTIMPGTNILKNQCKPSGIRNISG